MIQRVSYWKDAGPFPYGPFVAVRHPMDPGLWRIEKKAALGYGTEWPPLEDTLAAIRHFDQQPGWNTLEIITPIVEWLNDREAAR